MKLEEIKKRKLEIAEELKNENADLESLEKEVRSLNENETELINSIQKRSQMTTELLDGANKRSYQMSETRKPHTLDSVEYRNAWANALMQNELSVSERQVIQEVNNRALDSALTTTSTEFSAPTAGANGVNNGGLFIPKYVSDALLDTTVLDSPILRDVQKMFVAGMTSFPYEKYSTDAQWVKEGVCNVDEVVEWAELTFFQRELSKTIRITWKLEKMTPDSFLNYIIAELRKKMFEQLAESVIYGSGTTADDLNIMGIDKTNIKTTYINADNIVDKLVSSVLLLPKRKRRGIKAYISDEMMVSLSLQKDAAGAYLLPPINGVGLNSVGTIKVEVDPYLKDGDFVLGDLNWYILNQVENVSITKDISGRCRINDYTAWAIYGGNIMPDSIVFGSRSGARGIPKTMDDTKQK